MGNFVDPVADGGDDPLPFLACDGANDPPRCGTTAKAASVFALDKIFALDGLGASMGLVKSSSDAKSGYFAVCPGTASFGDTCGGVDCEDLEVDDALIFNVNKFCYWSAVRVRQMGLPPGIAFVNATGYPIAEGKLL